MYIHVYIYIRTIDRVGLNRVGLMLNNCDMVVTTTILLPYSFQVLHSQLVIKLNLFSQLKLI